jgi:hypothetical protein
MSFFIKCYENVLSMFFLFFNLPILDFDPALSVIAQRQIFPLILSHIRNDFST